MGKFGHGKNNQLILMDAVLSLSRRKKISKAVTTLSDEQLEDQFIDSLHKHI